MSTRTIKYLSNENSYEFTLHRDYFNDVNLSFRLLGESGGDNG